MYDRYRGSYLSKLLGMDENIIANIIHCVQYIDFDVYALDFVKENSKIYNHMYPIKTRINEVVVGLTELIYRLVIWNVDLDMAQCISRLLYSDKNLYQNEIIDLVGKLLKEHIRRMNMMVKETGYPIGIILQMMDYPPMDKEQYHKCTQSMIRILDNLSYRAPKNGQEEELKRNIHSMQQNGLSAETIAKYLNKSIDIVRYFMD